MSIATNKPLQQIWTREDELLLIKEISHGKSLDTLANSEQFKGRDKGALEWRLSKIIFENVWGGKTISNISKALNVPYDKTNEYFNSYKKFRDNHAGISAIDGIEHGKEKVDEQTGGENGDILINKINKRIKDIEKENNMIKIIIENKELHKKLDKMVKDGTINHNVKLLVKEFKKRNNDT